jgi:alcohol-forming fatty acyl-CoA reductase
VSAPTNSRAHATKVAAFFDLDSTILAAPSLEWRFVGYLLERNQLKTANAGAWLAYFAKTILLSPREALAANKRYLAGLRESLARDFSLTSRETENLAAKQVFFPEALARIAWHQAQDHRVCIVSGTLAVLARELLPALPTPIDVVATELETASGYLADTHDIAPVFTGSLNGPHMTGLAKARAVWRYADSHAIDVTRSFAYGDRNADVPMLDAVGHPVAVNPSKRLARIARENNWDVVRWGSAATDSAIHRNTVAPITKPSPQPGAIR